MPDVSAHTLVQMSLIGESVDGGPALVFVADENMRYAAVNAYACELLGYTREELLALSVPDVVRDPGAPDEYAEMLARGERTGTSTLRRKDGSELEFVYRASKTTLAGLPYYVAVGWPA